MPNAKSPNVARPSASLDPAVSREATAVIGAGFIGSALASHLADRAIPVTVVTRRPARRRIAGHGAEHVVIPVPDQASLVDVFRRHAHVVLAAGGYSPVTAHGRVAEAVQTELGLVQAALAALRYAPATTLTFLSSGGTVYGNAERIPTDESAPTLAIGAYGLAKLAGEQLIQDAHDQDGVHARILRISNVYGPGQPATGGQGVVGSAFRAAVTGEPMTLVDGGRAIRDFVYIDDVASVIRQMTGLREGFLVMNVGSGVGTAIADVVQAVGVLTGREVPVHPVAARPFDVRASVLDISRLRSLTSISATPLADGLAVTCAWLGARASAEVGTTVSTPPLAVGAMRV